MSNNKFDNKYRIPTCRLQNYNYSANGCYYVTICTKNHVHYFGEIVNSQMQLSKIGKIAQSEWLKTAELRPDMNLSLDEFVVMPNHFHCIIFIGKNQHNTLSTKSLQSYKNKFGAQTKNLASIMRGFKSAVTTYARKHDIDFAWQERFYDRIIRDGMGLSNVRSYIFNNPQNWNKDELNEEDVNDKL